MAKKDQLPMSPKDLANLVKGAAKSHAVAQSSAEPMYSASLIVRATNSRNFMLNDEKLPRPLRVVVLGSAFVQNKYDQAYDPENKVPPICFAVSGPSSFEEAQSGKNFELLLAPHETSPQKQHDGPCATCPRNKPGTGEKGGFTRDCQGRRRLGFIFADDKSKDPQVGSTEISAGGLRAWAKFVKDLANIEGIPTYFAVIDLDFVENEAKDTWYIGATYVGPLAEHRPEWLTPEKGVKVGSEGWLETTFIGKKMKGMLDGKQLLSVPTLMAPTDPKAKKKGKPVTGAARMSVKEAKSARKGAKK